MGLKIAGKTGKYGIIRHNKTNSAATVFKAIGSTNNQWTNPVLEATNFRSIYFTALTPMIESGAMVDNYNLTSQYGLNSELSNFHIDSNSGLAKFNFSAIADRLTLASILAMAMQGVSEAETGDYFIKTFTSGFSAGPIDFNQGGGYTFGLCEKIGASADDGTLLQNAIIDSLTITIDFNQKGVGRLMGLNGTIVGKSVAFDQTLTGSFITTTFTPIGNTNLFSLSTFTSDSVDLTSNCLKRIEITINNSVTSNCHTTGGAPNQYDCTPQYLVNMYLNHNSLTEKLRGDFKAGASVAIDLSNDISTPQTGHLRFEIPVLKQIVEPMIYEGDFYAYNLQMRAYQSGPTSPLTIYFADNLDWDF